MIKAALKGLSYLILLKIFSKILDFVLNVLVIRNLDTEIFGMTMHFTLLFNICYFYVKHCLKNLYLKRTITISELDNKEMIDDIIMKSAKNLMTIGVYFTIIFSTLVGILWVFLYGSLNEGYPIAVFLYCLSATIETMHEPLIVQTLLNFEYKTVAAAEGVGIGAKTILLFLLIRFTTLNPLVAFGLAQLFSSILIVIASYIMIKKKYPVKISDIFTLNIIQIKKGDQNEYYIHKDMKNIGIQLSFIMFLKFLLTEIEKIILMNMGANVVSLIYDSLIKDIQLKSSAEYILVSNLGSMIPRYLFAPTEEICFNLFAQMNNPSDQDKKNNDKEAQFNVIHKVYKLINILGLFLITFGLNYSYAIINFLYGDKWSTPSTIQAMQAYFVYIYIMGLNGISEAYLYSTMNEKALKTFRYFIIMNTTIYIILCLILIQYETTGLILANSISMIIRICICIGYMSTQIPSNKSILWFIRSTLPNKLSIIGLMITFLLSRIICNEGYNMSVIRQLLIAAVFGVANVGLVFKLHKDDIMNLVKEKNIKTA